jgi:hypothetical protein
VVGRDPEPQFESIPGWDPAKCTGGDLGFKNSRRSKRRFAYVRHGSIVENIECLTIFRYIIGMTRFDDRVSVLALLLCLTPCAASGGGAAITMTPSPGYVWSWNLGQQGNPATLSVTNSGSTTLTLSAPYYTLSGPNAADFAVSGGTCADGRNVAPTSSCTIIVNFTPSQYTDEVATLNINGNADGSVALNGWTKAVDWTNVGIPGGIPDANWPVCKTISPSGGPDDSTAIQNAVNSCAGGSVVMLTAGTYTLHRTTGTVCVGKSDDYGSGVYEAGLCLTDKSIALRGAGPDQTVLNYGDGASIISMGKTYLSHSNINFINITGGATKGSTSVTLANTSGITPGTYLTITEANPNDPFDGSALSTATGYTGSCGYCGHDLPSNLMEQVDRVTAINGNVINLERPLYFDYTSSPQVYVLPMIENVGLENLRVVGTAASGTSLTFKNINVEACAHCWVHNVESDMAVDKSNIYLSDTYGNEISNNYLNDGYNHNSGADYALLLEFRNSEDLIQNNIIRRPRHSTPQSGGAGNVYAYNYELLGYMGEYPDSLPETQAHGAHPFMNLWEGNMTENFEWDNAHGSSSHNTMFRNYLNMTDTNPATNSQMGSGLIALNIAYFSDYNNVIGNVLGPYGAPCNANTYETDASTPKAGAVIWQLGYYDDGGGSTPSQALSNKVGNTLTRGGNYDCVSGSVVWSNNIPSGSSPASSYIASRTLPDSLVFTAAPGYFAATGAAWPPIDPAATTKVNPIPAKICYESGPGRGAQFNPTNCYGNGATLQPPTGLIAIPH